VYVVAVAYCNTTTATTYYRRSVQVEHANTAHRPLPSRIRWSQELVVASANGGMGGIRWIQSRFPQLPPCLARRPWGHTIMRSCIMHHSHIAGPEEHGRDADNEEYLHHHHQHHYHPLLATIDCNSNNSVRSAYPHHRHPRYHRPRPPDPHVRVLSG
jgi:hypothetical protein